MRQLRGSIARGKRLLASLPAPLSLGKSPPCNQRCCFQRVYNDLKFRRLAGIAPPAAPIDAAQLRGRQNTQLQGVLAENSGLIWALNNAGVACALPRAV